MYYAAVGCLAAYDVDSDQWLTEPDQPRELMTPRAVPHARTMMAVTADGKLTMWAFVHGALTLYTRLGPGTWQKQRGSARPAFQPQPYWLALDKQTLLGWGVRWQNPTLLQPEDCASRPCARLAPLWGVGYCAVLDGKLYLTTKEATRQMWTIDVSAAGDASATPQRLAQDMSCSRTGARAVGLDHKLYVCGGTSTRRCECYDPARGVWTEITATHHARCHSAIAVAGPGIYVMGGIIPDGHGGLDNVNSVEEYDSVLNQWRLRSPLPEQFCGETRSTISQSDTAVTVLDE